MKILRNMVIVALMGVTGWIFAMAIDPTSKRWQNKPLKEKLEIVGREKEAALNRFRAKVGNDTLEEVQKEADVAKTLDDLENVLLIEQSQEKIKDLQESLDRVRGRLRRASSWFSSSSSSRDSSFTKEEIKQAERKIELELDKERDNLKKLQHPNLEYQ
jgi:hypothetical protein